MKKSADDCESTGCNTYQDISVDTLKQVYLKVIIIVSEAKDNNFFSQYIVQECLVKYDI